MKLLPLAGGLLLAWIAALLGFGLWQTWQASASAALFAALLAGLVWCTCWINGRAPYPQAETALRNLRTSTRLDDQGRRAGEEAHL